MPYKSEKQRRFFHAAASRKEIDPEVVKEYDRASKGKNLPEKANKRFSKTRAAMKKGK